MADIVLGIGTSHTPMLSLAPELWSAYAERDSGNPELAYPPHGWVMSYQEALEYLPQETRDKYQGDKRYKEQAAAFKQALDTLAASLQEARPDVTIIISDDQDEWFYEDNMPRFSIYWGDTVRLLPRPVAPGGNPEIAKAMMIGYGDVPMDVPVASAFGRYLLEYLNEHNFDVAHMTHSPEQSGGRVARRYPTKNGELNYVRETPRHEQGLPTASPSSSSACSPTSPGRSCRSSRTPATRRTSPRRSGRSRSGRPSPRRSRPGRSRRGWRWSPRAA